MRSPRKYSRVLYLPGEIDPGLWLILIRGAEIKTLNRTQQVAVSGWHDQREIGCCGPLCDRQAMNLNTSFLRIFENGNEIEVHSGNYRTLGFERLDFVLHASAFVLYLDGWKVGGCTPTSTNDCISTT